MTYTDWSALPLERKNALCAEAMGWERSSVALDACWCSGGECLRDVEDWSPCTDRNDAAMMVERLYELDSAEESRARRDAFETILFNASGASNGGFGDWDTLTISPDLLALAAYTALAKEA